MANFFKIVFGSALGFFISLFLLLMIFFAILGGIKSIGDQEEITLNPNTILSLHLNYPILDRTSNKPENIFDFSSMFKIPPGLNDILSMIESAKEDPKIKGIYLNLNDIPTSYSNILEIRNSLKEFKSSGKFILAYGDHFSQKAYYLASIADEIYLHPEGSIDLKGIYVQMAFFKGLLDKLDIDAQVVRHGKFKSAVEPFLLDKMSNANREQTKKYTNSIWETVSTAIATGRNISVDKVNQAADLLSLQDPDKAIELGFIEEKIYFDVFLSKLSEKLNIERVDKKNFISESKYNKIKTKKEKWSSDKIAVIYASGNIIRSSTAVDGAITDGEFSSIIRDIRLDNKIKGVVLRINSPGGDALASDIILREVELLKNIKPVVVSMGGVAASGGYYIACKSDYIFANPNTITGSIGVFGVIPNLEKLFNNKLGVTFDEVKSNENSDYISLNKTMPTFHREKLKEQIEHIYNSFITHVSQGRSISKALVDSIGQGRVWAGKEAIKIGLIDEFGGLQAAIKKTAELAELDTYRCVDYPKQKEMMQQILEDLSGQSSISLVSKQFGDWNETYTYLSEVMSKPSIQARIPYLLTIE